MQEQYTIRIYDTRMVNKLEKLYTNCKDIFKSKNPFLVDCITRGAEAIEKDLFGTGKPDSINNLYEEIHMTVSKLNQLIKLCEKNAKETLAHLSINEKLMSCNYNMLLGLTDNAPKRKDFVESGMYDELPKRLSEILEEILEQLLSK